ncbi:catechol 2,3-dioxygenase-like lactoylglutathione lyase family enzyme [Arenibacter algicola]|uniref:Catechol 2,3-dioxygenase-like lactoylglutathione lyase family enzyme n=1 Tax=Arenibacter algicola TaxID=616991 RepID=A0ABY3AIT6_9FLAO|tara:strand:+ start:267 stop:689 length:423 start_codon:yes stop_codon:yes gene_type:complete
MTDKEHKIEIEFLDHVAIRVADLEASALWYEKVLGLKRYQLSEWGEFPIFLLSGKSGIALFPANTTDTKLDPISKNVKIDHFAFNVTNENFEKAKKRYVELNLEFNIQDHIYFDSIYTKDLDGHTVELTTIKVNEQEFYK